MYKNIFFFLLIRYLKSNSNAIILVNFNLKLNKVFKKKILTLFVELKNLVEKNVSFLNNKGSWLTSSDFSLSITKNSGSTILNYGLNTSFVNFSNTKLTVNDTNSFLTNYYQLYMNFFTQITLKNKYFLSNFFYYFSKKQGEGMFLLNFFALKRNFLKTSFLIVNILYLNYTPYIITHKEFDNTLLKLNIYLQLSNSFFRYGLIFCTSPYVQLKKVFNAKKKNIPLIAIADLSTNTRWIDYPIIIDKSTKSNSFFFFCFILNTFFSLLLFRKKKYINLYTNYKNINYLKEFILKNEYNIKKNVIWLLITSRSYLRL